MIYEYIDSSFARNHLSHQLYSLLERTMLHLNAGFDAGSLCQVTGVITENFVGAEWVHRR